MTRVPIKRKILRKPSIVKAPSVELVQPDLPFSESEPVTRKVIRKVIKKKSPIDTENADKSKIAQKLATAVDNLMLRGRAYRLSIGSLGDQRALSLDERERVMSRQAASVRTRKELYDPKDPHLKALRSAMRDIRIFFEAQTVSHPEEATRLFVIKEQKNMDWTKLSPEEAETLMASQLDAFHKIMQERIDRYYDTEVKSVMDNWPDIIERAKVYTADLFDRAQYPAQSELRDLLYVRFYPVPSTLPPEYNRIDPEMRSRIAAYTREQVELSLAQHITSIEDALTTSLTMLQERVVAAGSEGVGQRFYASRVTDVLEAIEAYERTMGSIGLSLGKALPDRLSALRAQIKRVADDPHAVVKQLKTSSTNRNELLSSLSEAISATSNAFAPVRRRITID